jgi:uncharacterized protein YndB with AHSA1/START domain
MIGRKQAMNPEHPQHSISVTTEIAAAPQRVYDAWLSASDLRHWMSARVEIHPVIGGTYRLTWDTEDGTIYAHGTYLELDPGRKIVQTWTPVGPDGDTGSAEVEIRLEFRESDTGGTEMTQTETGPGFQTPEQIAESEEGTRLAHDALKHHLEVHGR